MAVASVGRSEHRDPVGAGCGEGVDLCSVVCGRIGRHEQLIGAVPIAARTQVAADDQLDAVELPTELPKKINGIAVDAVEGGGVVAEPLPPVRWPAR